MTAKVSAIYLVQNVIVNLSLVIMITKIKLYGDKINKIFKEKKYQNKMHHISAYLEECKNEIKKEQNGKHY